MITLFLRHAKKNNKGLVPVYLRISINYKERLKSTGHYILPGQWNEQKQIIINHPSADELNADITLLKNKALTDVVATKITGKKVEIKDILPVELNYFDFVDAFREEVKNKRSGSTLENYRKHTKKLEDFLGERKLPITDITPDFLNRFEGFIYKEGSGSNYAHAVLKTLRTMINAARKKKLIKDYPFDQYEMPIYTPPDNDALSEEDIMKLEEYADNVDYNIIYRTAVVYLLLGVNTGLRVSDWYKFSIEKNIKRNMVLVRAKKNRQWVTMPLTNAFKRNIERMKRMPLNIAEQTINEKLQDHVFPELQINKEVSTHTGRHTFAVTLCADRGVSCETCAELMGITVKTCLENYYRVTPEKILAETSRAWKGL